jgi:hypothetical protein
VDYKGSRFVEMAALLEIATAIMAAKATETRVGG